MEASKPPFDKQVLDEKLAELTEWHRALILDNEGKVIASKNLSSEPSTEEIKY